MFIVGLTGGISTGKSLVSSMAREMDIAVIDADQIAHKAAQQGQPAYKKMVAAFGPGILTESGDIDRLKLGSIVFGNAERRSTLNRLIHPYIYADIRREVLRYILQGNQFVILDLPLLYESGNALNFIYKTIVVACEPAVQLQRLMTRNEFTKAEAMQRIDAQMPLDEKVAIADYVIDNSGSIPGTRKQLEAIVRILKSSNHHIQNRLLYGGSTLAVLILAFFLLYYLALTMHQTL